ncbi:hypothetical protein EH165_03885 [Nakamurella antarctica]|uniref:Uncharacterized protein n=1 Tax=Nakamurella antarctica TaxID=1902245 RepID=A0A3G8ZKW6_9ACTN|nr:hypothetical protein [Nakamurella antarctica]AZI57427.1 hypothetical protein EH165_03885 [Nakamurella antarctica]
MNSAAIDTKGTQDVYTATLVIGDLSADVIHDASGVYVKGNKEMAERIEQPDLTNGWVHWANLDPRAQSLIALTSPVSLIGIALNNPEPLLSYTTGSLTAGVEGEGVQVLLTEQNVLVGTILVSTIGAPWPLHALISDPTGSIDLSMTEWDTPITVAAPTALVEAKPDAQLKQAPTS